MFPKLRVSSSIFRQLLRTKTNLDAIVTRACSIETKCYNEHDPAPIFFDQKVQDLLKRVTGMDFDKIFRSRLNEKVLEVPKYEFLTDSELDERMAETRKRAERLLQMPPVLKERVPIEEVISNDPALKGYDTCKYVFTDITFGMTDRKRIILVRESDGVLRQASWEVRDRINQLYNPRPGRKILVPKVFREENLKDVLAREKYEFVLDRACAQFEPDDPEYHHITSTTYAAVEARRHYQMLHSTRHYGPMCFYLAWNRKMDNLLIDLIQKEMLSNAADLVQLYHIIHADCKSKTLNVDQSQHIEFIKAYMEHDSVRRPQLQLAVQAYEDLLNERQQYEKDVKLAHGL
ncbi:small ribosomal subunit protein mS22-like [Penaeus indicus]|uniref:small ribosomal subunit protein mS22-like n=1 Tax=Penaeus indicus TaxID=29960 RepID=UPI00300CC393